MTGIPSVAVPLTISSGNGAGDASLGAGTDSPASALSAEGAVSDRLLAAVDKDLEPLLDILRRRAEPKRRVVALGLWQHRCPVELLPFHLHLRWSDGLEGLPLNAAFSLVPAPSYVDLPAVYRVRDAVSALQRGRSARARASRRAADDLTPPDWEVGYSRHTEKLRDLVLAGSSFLSVDTIAPETGSLEPGHRSVLGRYAGRSAPRPAVRVPGRGEMTEASAAALRAADLLLIDLQRLRGPRALQTARSVIAEPSRGPALIVASSPTDLLALDVPLPAESFEVIPFGTLPPAPSLLVREVGRDRLVAERGFAFATALEPGSSANAAFLAKLATDAWWAVRQSLRTDGAPEPEVERLKRALDRLEPEAPDEVKRFRHAASLIEDDAAQERAKERLRAVIDEVERAEGGDILVLTRTTGAAGWLQSELSTHLGVSVADLVELGVRVQSYRAAPPRAAPGTTIATGYFGRDMLDALLTTRATRGRCVFDPVEIRAAWFGAQSITNLLRDRGLIDAARPIVSIAEQLRPHVTGFTDTIELSLSFDISYRTESSETRVPSPSASRDRSSVAICMTDGERFDAPRNARFDVLPSAGGRARTHAACELRPGDRVVLLNYDQHSTFSARLIAELDRGPLQKEAHQRALWAMLLSAARSEPGFRLPDVVKAMADREVRVDDATVRAWLRPGGDELSAASAPRGRAAFMAFAEAMRITLPEAALLNLWNAIRRWRTLHRKAGRDLARVIRAVSLNRLDAPSLARVEATWGLSARHLLQAARVAVVDEVFTP
jgi:hypothetical protein